MALAFCPRCGGKAYYHALDGEHWVSCSVNSCGARTDYYSSRIEALNAWPCVLVPEREKYHLYKRKIYLRTRKLRGLYPYNNASFLRPLNPHN